jgi:hypothetical protein
MDKQLDKLNGKKIRRYENLYTDGVLIKKCKLSQYIKECYTESVKLEEGINGHLEYRYYLDRTNKVCVLFTQPWIDDFSDKKEVLDKSDALVVEIYVSPGDFAQGNLALFYHNHYVVPGKYTWGWDETTVFGPYETNCEGYNEISIVKDIAKLLNPEAIDRIDTIQSIING